jgi:hypothetical protein
MAGYIEHGYKYTGPRNLGNIFGRWVTTNFSRTTLFSQFILYAVYQYDMQQTLIFRHYSVVPVLLTMSYLKSQLHGADADEDKIYSTYFSVNPQ